MTPEQELDLRMAEPVTEAREVILMQVVYPDSPRTYTYAALGLNGGWWLTGRDGATEHTWDSMVAWLKTKNAEVTYMSRATSWEDIL